MHSQADTFADRFDSISVETTSVDEMRPGFSLLDDAGGRFGIDRETGVITLLRSDLLDSEAGAQHPVHVRVVEPSGAQYELSLTLRMTGLVPQVAGAEEFDALTHMARAPESRPAPSITVTPAAKAPSPWTPLAARGDESAPFGALCAAQLPSAPAPKGEFSLGAAPPRPGAADAVWAI